jgi:hypothetical protein
MQNEKNYWGIQTYRQQGISYDILTKIRVGYIHRPDRQAHREEVDLTSAFYFCKIRNEG